VNLPKIIPPLLRNWNAFLGCFL